MSPEDHPGYARIADGNTLLRELERRLQKKKVRDMRPGDVISLRNYTTTYHVAIVTPHAEGLGLIHAWSPQRKVVEHRMSKRWSELVVSCFEFPGVSEAT